MTPTSNSQARVLKLIGVAVPADYADAAKALDAAGCREDGIPQGGTWRTAKKMSDAELLAAVKIDHEAAWFARFPETVDR